MTMRRSSVEAARDAGLDKFKVKMRGFKVLSHDYRSPIQTGDPIWDGKTLPFTLPRVELDTGNDECAAGWNFCADLTTAIRIAGLWPSGRPAVAFEVEAEDAIARGDKRRASTLTLVDIVDDDAWANAIWEFSSVFGEHQEVMSSEQLLWFRSLSRPRRDHEAVQEGLRRALGARLPGGTGGPDWELKQYESTRAAWAAWAAWEARDAWAALTLFFAVRMRWVAHAEDLLTVGLRDAYEAGLGIAIPTGPNELGWAMDQEAA